MAPSRMLFFTTIHQTRRLDFRQSMIIVTNESFEILSRYHWTSIEIVDTPGCAALVPAQIVPSEEVVVNNSPVICRMIIRARSSILKIPYTTIHQIWAKSNGTLTIPTYQCFGTCLTIHLDGRLLEQEDPSPTVDVQQFTRLGQKSQEYDGPSRRVHSPDSGGKSKGLQQLYSVLVDL
eukprot:scaffold5537_cov65-Cylindrotheca_fusiformis.AAC.1